MDSGVVLGAALTCAVGGILPWINAEIVVLGAAALLPTTSLPALVGACALGQMASKTGVYSMSRWAPHVVPARARALLDRAERYRGGSRTLVCAVLLGSATSVPPFYLVTLASGLLRVPILVFCVVGLVGTGTRYFVLVWAACSLSAGSCP